MPIVAAAVEANGWVLRLDVSGSLGSFASYMLDPDGTPRVTLTSDHGGFVPSGGEAVAATLARALVGTKPLRVAAEVSGVTLQPARIDEVDLGGGIIRVRIALTEHVYASDSNLRLAVAAGWRSGEAAASNIVVTNNSTVVAPIPIMRWALTPMSVVGAAFRLSLIVFSHHPNGFQPVAGVRFSVTDGTTVKTAWTTALATDNSLGDNLRCYTAVIDPATATALTQGLLRCDAEVYPWLGSMRPTDTPGTRSMTGLRAAAVSVNASTPFVVGYDPAGTRYGAMFAAVDPVNGTATPAAGMVQSTLAGAKAVAAASRPRDINTAIQAGYLFNRTLPAANGQAAITRSIDGMQIVLAPGTHADGAGATAVTFGLNSPEIPIRIIGDPDNANPRANCILQTAASRAISRGSRVLLQRLTLEVGGAAMMGSGQEHVIVDDCIVRGKPGLETDTVPLFNGTVVAGTWSFAMTRSRWWRTGANIAANNVRMGLMRGCEHSRLVANVQCAVKNRVIPRSEDATLPAIQTGIAFSGWLAPTLAGQAEDLIVAYNDIRSWEGRAWTPSVLPAATAGTPFPSVRRQAFVGNLCERIVAARSTPRLTTAFSAIGEGVLLSVSYTIIDGNTYVGERLAHNYNEPPSATLAEANDLNSSLLVNRLANNSLAYLGTKHDDFNNSVTAATRVAAGQSANPYRPQLIGGWSVLYGVGYEANAVLRTSFADVSFAEHEFYGRRSHVATTPTIGAYTDDRSYDGSNTGGGVYMPTATSPARARAVRGQCDVDFNGTVRPAIADAGAFQTIVTALTPAGARSGMIAPSPALGWIATLSPTAARSGHRAAASATSWSTAILPATDRLGHRGQATTIGWFADLAPSTAMSAQRTAATDLALAFALRPAAATLELVTANAGLSLEALLTLAPASGRHVATAGAASLLTAATAVRATIIVAADARSFIPDRN